MTHARTPVLNVLTADGDRVPFHADPILAAIERHEEAYAVFQVAPDGDASEAADAETFDALHALLATPCATRAGMLCLIRHLRWFLSEEAPNADAYSPHPDRALLDLAATLAQAEEVETRTARDSAAAWDAVSAVLRTRPIALVPSRWEWGAVIEHGRSRAAPLSPRMHHIPTDPGALPEDHQRWQNAWTGEGLRYAIANAVRLFGKGGRTPHRIANWKSLLPIADAFDAQVATVYAATDAKRLANVAQDARERARALRIEIEDYPATTPEGLAVHLRVFLSADSYKGKTDHTALTLSTAAVACVPLPESDIDPAEWVASWERLGGSIKRHPRRHGRDELMFVCPDAIKAEPSRLAKIQRLLDEHRANDRAVARWIYANR